MRHSLSYRFHVNVISKVKTELCFPGPMLSVLFILYGLGVVIFTIMYLISTIWRRIWPYFQYTKEYFISKALFAHHLSYLTLHTPEEWYIHNHRVILQVRLPNDVQHGAH